MTLITADAGSGGGGGRCAAVMHGTAQNATADKAVNAAKRDAEDATDKNDG